MVQKLKGSMRVYCRIKPLDTTMDGEGSYTLALRASAPDTGKSCVDVASGTQSSGLPIGLHFFQEKETLTYHFDGVFGAGSEQTQVFEEVKPFIQSAIDGENVGIVAYGQTGSGKTFRMEGPNEACLFDSEMKLTELSGILPRTACFIQEEVSRLQKFKNNKIEVEISALEIYCETVKDLFSEEVIELQTDRTKKVRLNGQTWRQIDKLSDFLQSIKLSASRRVFGNNGVNAHSSRSHHIFQIRIKGYDKLEKQRTSLLSIVDLAGSERRKETASIQPGQESKVNKSVNKSQQKSQDDEGISINKSLTTLGRIFSMLSNRKQWKEKPLLPYRESKLTRILQDSLTYDSKTVMILNVCSNSSTARQTKESLNFGQNAVMTL